MKGWQEPDEDLPVNWRKVLDWTEALAFAVLIWGLVIAIAIAVFG